MREWGHLHLCILRELDRYDEEHRQTWRVSHAGGTGGGWCAFVRGGMRKCYPICKPATAEAAVRVRDLERALQQLQTLEQQRVEVWRGAAHDLRGTVGVIATASALITNQAVEDSARTQFSDVLQRNVNSLRELLNDLMDLSRLEAGEEHRNVAPFDAARMLRELAESLRGVATNRNLF